MRDKKQRRQLGSLSTLGWERRVVCKSQIGGDSCLSPGSAPVRRQGPRQACLQVGAVGGGSPCLRSTVRGWNHLKAGSLAGLAAVPAVGGDPRWPVQLEHPPVSGFMEAWASS